MASTEVGMSATVEATLLQRQVETSGGQYPLGYHELTHSWCGVDVRGQKPDGGWMTFRWEETLLAGHWPGIRSAIIATSRMRFPTRN